MPTIIHLADLHLSVAEEDYALAVLNEIIETAIREQADYVLLCGDIFNSGSDAYDLRDAFRRQINRLAEKAEIFYLPGNHEFLQGDARKLASLDLGKLNLLTQTPFTLLSRPQLEFLAIPHQGDYKTYRDWQVKPKAAGCLRLALAHASIAGMSFTGLEEGGSVMDPDLFDFFQVDYAALGHIHDRRSLASDNCLLHYPGSARIWRRGESGPRGMNLIKMTDNLQVTFLPLAAAGEYREYTVAVNFDGLLQLEESVTAAWQPADWIELSLSGVVENEPFVSQQVEDLQRRFAGRVRQLKILHDRLAVFAGISSHPMAHQFIRLWQASRPKSTQTEEIAVWMEARELGLLKIRELLEARQ